MNTSTMIRSRLVLASLALASAFALGACSLDAMESEGGLEDGLGEEETIGSTEQEISSGWTPYTSEEYPPIICDSGSLMSAVHCTGSKCDNIQAYCQPTGGSLGATYWTSYFSEEGTNYRYCNSGYWVTGIACTGGNCDNISLMCSQITNKGWGNCHWTGWVSEEYGGYLTFAAGYFPQGVQCSGSNCDNKRFYVCQAQ